MAIVVRVGRGSCRRGAVHRGGAGARLDRVAQRLYRLPAAAVGAFHGAGVDRWRIVGAGVLVGAVVA